MTLKGLGGLVVAHHNFGKRFETINIKLASGNHRRAEYHKNEDDTANGGNEWHIFFLRLMLHTSL